MADQASNIPPLPEPIEIQRKPSGAAWPYRVHHVSGMGYVVWRDVFDGGMRCSLRDAIVTHQRAVCVMQSDAERIADLLDPPALQSAAPAAQQVEVVAWGERKRVFGLWTYPDSSDSSGVIDSFATWDDAVAAWLQSGEKYNITGLDCGVLATAEQLKWRYGTPDASARCPLCLISEPHQHTGEEVHMLQDSRRLDVERKQKDWDAVMQRVKTLEATHQATPPQAAQPDQSGDATEMVAALPAGKVTEGELEDFVSHKLPWRAALVIAGSRPGIRDEDALYWKHELAAFDRAQAFLSLFVAEGEREAQRVFLVATGEVYEGRETYERYEGAPPPLCDYEVLYTTPQPTAAAGQVPDADALAQFIRQIDGDHSMGAGALAERICEWLAAAPQPKEGGAA